MKCANCGAESPGAGPFCAQCGASLRQDTLRPTSSFSYLPEGTPSWPTTIPDKLPFVAQANSKVPASQESPSKPEKRAKPPARQVALTALMVILIPLVGVLATLGVLYSQGAFAAASQGSASKPPTLPPAGQNLTPTPAASSQK